MAGSTELRRGLAVLLAVVLAVSSGCATGGLVEAGRQIDGVVRFDRAYTDGDRLWLVYRAQRRGSRGGLAGVRERAAVVHIEDLDPERLYPVDTFPVEHLRPRRLPSRDLESVALQRAGADSPDGLVVVSADGVDEGLLVDGLSGAAAGSYLRSAALRERRIALWVFPLYPLAFVYDAFAVPFLAVLAVPSFMGSK